MTLAIVRCWPIFMSKQNNSLQIINKMKRVNRNLLTALIACVNVMESTIDDRNGSLISENESEVYENAMETIDKAKSDRDISDIDFYVDSEIVVKMAKEIREQFMTSNPLRDPIQVDRDLRGYICEMLNAIS